MRFNRTIAAKLAVAYILFLAPIGYLGYKTISDTEINIAFAEKEIIGVHYIADVRRVQDALARGSDMAPLSQRVSANERAFGAELKTAESTEALIRALKGADRAAAAQAAAELVSKAADGSNLTLDPDLDSFYTQDTLTVKVPTAVASVTSLALAVVDTAGHDISLADQVNIGVLTGALQPALGGLASDIGNSVRGNPDNTVDRALTPLVAKVNEVAKTVLATLADDHTRAADAQAIVRPLLDAITDAGDADARELEHLLNARIDGFRWAEMTSAGVALALFTLAVFYVLTVVQLGAVKALRALTATMRTLAAYDLTVAIGGTDRGDEVGSMAQAVLVFKEQMIERRRLDEEAAIARAASAERQRLLNEERAARSEAEASLAIAYERERAERDKEVQNARFGAALSNMSQALFMFDPDNNLIVVNSRAAEMFGLPITSITAGMHIEHVRTAMATQSKLQWTDTETIHRAVFLLKAEGKRASVISELADGRSLAVTVVPTDADGWLLTMEDVSERMLAEAKIAYMAHHDGLTGLPNRTLFQIRLSEAFGRSLRGDACAILCINLDHFKIINDTLGHSVGDALLLAVTERLRREVRETDTLARLGGDEFAVVQSSVDQPQDAKALAARLIEVLGAPYTLNGHPVLIGASIGIAIVPEDGEDPDKILKNAAIALHRAKSDGRGRYRFFEPGMDALMQARRALEIDLRKALAEGEFVMFYQPLIDLKTCKVSGFEALMRWQHPERGLVPPNSFIPVTEEMGLIVPLGEWALRQSCFDAVTWPDKMKVAVNVSVIQFTSGRLVEDVAAALEASGLEPCRLELEITETVMLDDTDSILVILHQLRDLGVGIAMDDFGTGYSSLSYLRRFPFSKVKIDRCFVDSLGQGGDCDAIVTAVTDLCETLGMITLAEGVETEQQLRQLRVGSCREAQGYLFSPARPASEVMSMCRRLNEAALSYSVG